MRAVQDRTSEPNVAKKAFEFHIDCHLATPVRPGCCAVDADVEGIQHRWSFRPLAPDPPTQAYARRLWQGGQGWPRDCCQMFGFATRLLQLTQWLALLSLSTVCGKAAAGRVVPGVVAKHEATCVETCFVIVAPHPLLD